METGGRRALRGADNIVDKEGKRSDPTDSNALCHHSQYPIQNFVLRGATYQMTDRCLEGHGRRLAKEWVEQGCIMKEMSVRRENCT